ncbi:PEGA domain-containing protein [Myxococcaceae bacterium GXIMD 01537]
MKNTPLFLAASLALATNAFAAPRRTVIAVGDCKDAELSSQSKALHDTLKTRPKEEILSASEFAERLFPQPSRSFEDIQRLLDAAQGQFYEGQHSKATQTLDDALKEVARLPPGEQRWNLYVGAQLLHGLNFRSLGRAKERESDAAFRNVLRIDAQHKLDPSHYAPSTRQAFEKVRRELINGRKARLSVKSTVPASEVYLDGFKAGQTPLSLNVPEGTYDIALIKGDAVSFPRPIQVNAPETPVLVDLVYEGGVTASPFPCLASQGNDDKTFGHAIRLGGTLGVEEVIVVRLEQQSSGPKWLAATVLNVEGGQKLREGGLKTQGLETPQMALNALVDFVTGKAPSPPVVSHQDGVPPWERGTGIETALAPATPEDLQNPAREALLSTPDRLGGHARPPQAPAVHTTSGLRVASYVVMGAGVAALGGAGVVRLMAQKDVDALSARLNAQGRISANDTEALALRNSLASKGNALTGLLIGSGAAFVTGGAMYLLSSSPAAPPVSVGLSVDGKGASATLSGAF